MADPGTPAVDVRAPYDDIAARLQRLRIDAGGVSYAEIAARITANRVAAGAGAAAARIARSTVYDAFQSGRHRLNADLVAEIVLALGGHEDQAAHWRRECLDVRRAAELGEQASQEGAAAVSEAAARADIPDASSSARGDAPHLLHRAFVLVCLIACVGLNLFDSSVINLHSMPVWFDMVGTAAAAFAFGPWHAVAVAIATHVFNISLTTPTAAVYVLVNVTGALCWGFGARWAGRRLARLAAVIIGTTIACAAVGAAVSVLVFGGTSGHASDAYVTALSEPAGVWLAAFAVNLVVSCIDKIPTAIIALVLARALRTVLARTRGTELASPLSRS